MDTEYVDNLTATLIDIRTRLTETRIALRHAAENHAVGKARAETAAIEAAGGVKGLGPNEASQNRALAIALAHDEEYETLYAAPLRELQDTVARLEAELVGAEDRRREYEWVVRERLAAALLNRQPSDVAHHPEDGAFDAGVDNRAYIVATEWTGDPGEIPDIPF